MAKRTVFIKELNTFGTEVDMTLTCSDYGSFLRVLDIKTLERILKTQLEYENYEMAELVKKHIEFKRVGKV
jgi:hypothetical protein